MARITPSGSMAIGTLPTAGPSSSRFGDDPYAPNKGSSGIDVGDHTGLNRGFSLRGNGCGLSLTVC